MPAATACHRAPPTRERTADNRADSWTTTCPLFAEYDVCGGFWVNIQLTFWAALISLVLGTILALMRISPVPSFALAAPPTSTSSATPR